MGVYFAVDVDTPSANPQELVTLLPESARFAITGVSSGDLGTVAATPLAAQPGHARGLFALSDAGGKPVEDLPGDYKAGRLVPSRMELRG